MVLCGYFYFFFSPSLKWLMNSYNQWLKNFWTECLCSQKKIMLPRFIDSKHELELCSTTIIRNNITENKNNQRLECVTSTTRLNSLMSLLKDNYPHNYLFFNLHSVNKCTAQLVCSILWTTFLIYMRKPK